MKYTFTKTWAFVALLTLTVGCAKEQISPEALSVNNSGDLMMGKPEKPTTGTGGYLNVYEGQTDNGDGTYTYTWSMQNNGAQNLSHWTMDLGTCVTIDDVESAKEGSDLNNMSLVNVEFKADPSFSNDNLTGCIYTNPVFKFNMGAAGTAKTYYCITITKNVATTEVTGYFKSGSQTGCGSFTFTGLGCETIVAEEGYSYSQGYWFARPKTVWGRTITMGGFEYSQEDGKAIWNSSNKKGLADSKAAFLQAAAIKLSGDLVGVNATVWDDVAIVDAYLKSLGKRLSVESPVNLPTGHADAKAAAGRISAWITAHHVDTTFGF